MDLKGIFSRSRKSLDGPEGGEGVSPVGNELDGNTETRRKQRMLLSGVAVVGVVAASMWIFSDNGKVAGQADDEIEDVQVSTKDMMNRNLSEQE